ncbi:hypothetical protein O181_034905 [Austropuccinia psidii MF-1]|uniref:Uncharacterized protein n=1 Tax=Austropuccinia psidii MF-1 TaxID=1389203 RepID=A0A9Q3HAP4_9BASI|nr:hypothetical protein [Austropuccinia psidii MF-1]
MEDARTFISSQRLSRAFDTLFESPEADITAIPVVRPESFPTGNSGAIPVLVQELAYGFKAAEVGTSAKPLDRDHELLSSSKNVFEPRKDGGTYEWLDTNVLQITSPNNKCLVEKPKHFVRGPEERVGPKHIFGHYLHG